MLEAIAPPRKVRIKNTYCDVSQPGPFGMLVKSCVLIYLAGSEGKALRQTDGSIEAQVGGLSPRWYAKDEIEYLD